MKIQTPVPNDAAPGKRAASRATFRRLSDAAAILPLIRRHLVAALAGCPQAVAIEALPISEDGLLGYELVPDREAHTYLILGCNAQGAPVLRETSFGIGRAGAVELVAVNGRRLSGSGRAARHGIHPRDCLFPDWIAAAEAAAARLRLLFPGSPRVRRILSEKLRGFEDALSSAHSRLARWDPTIQFFGVPNEAELGFALRGTHGEAGALTFQQPGLWTLRWNAPPDAIHESLSAIANSNGGDGCGEGVCDFPDRRRRNRRATDRGRSLEA